MTVSEVVSNGADDGNVAWAQTATKTILGITIDPSDDTYSLLFEAERDGQFGFAYASTAVVEALGEVYTGNLTQIEVYINGEPATVVDGSTVASQYPGITGIDGMKVTGAIMQAGDVFEVRLVGNGMEPPVITMANVTFRLPETYNITLNAPAEGGSYTYDNGTVSGTINPGDASVSLSYNSITGLELEATPASGYKFLSWNDGNDEAYSGSETLLLKDEVTGNELTPEFMDENATVNFVVNGNPYETWTQAFTAAAATDAKMVVAVRYGGEYELPADATPDGTYIINEGGTLTYVVPSGFKLLVPYNGAEDGTFRALDQESPDDTTTEGGFNQSVFAKLTVPTGVKLKVAGQLNVNAQQYKSGPPLNGQVAGQYGQLVVNGTVDLLNGARFYCYGYATGSGQIHAASGSIVHELLQVTDWMGGTNTLRWFTSFAQQKITAGEDGGSFAFNQYYAQNIECEYRIDAGALSYMDHTLYMSNMTICAAPQFAGPTGLFQINSGYLLRHYDPVSDRMIYDFYGNVTTGNVSVDFSSYGAGLTMDSSGFILGITNNLTLNIHDGSYLTLNSSYQLLPEFTANVMEGGTLEVAEGTTLYIWDKNDWNAGNFAGGAKSRDMVYSPTRAVNKTSASQCARPMSSSTAINLDGLLIMHNNVYTTDNGGRDIRKAITSTQGKGEILNTEGQTTPNLRVIGSMSLPENIVYNSAEAETYYPTINCSIVVGHMYEQDDLNDYAPILTGEYHYKRIFAADGTTVVREGWYNNYVTVHDLDDPQAEPVEYPVGTDSFELVMDEAHQKIFSDYTIISNAEFDEENSVVFSNHDGSETYYAKLAFKIGQGAEIGVHQAAYDYIFGWAEFSSEGLSNAWYDIITGTPEDSVTTSAIPYTPEQIAVAAQEPGNELLTYFNSSYGVSNLDDFLWTISLVKQEINPNGEGVMERAAPILGQKPMGVSDAIGYESGTISATLNAAMQSTSKFVLIPLFTHYDGLVVTWRTHYPDDTVSSALGGATYSVPSGDRYVIDGDPTIYGNRFVQIDDSSRTLKSITLMTTRGSLVGDLTVDVYLKAYAYEINYTVNNTSTTDSTKVKDFQGHEVNWGNAYSKGDLAFDTTYVSTDGKDVTTGEAVILTYENLVGYDSDSIVWRITNNNYSDSSTAPAKFAFKSASTANDALTVEIDNSANGSVLKLKNITGDETVTVDMYGYHYIADITVNDLTNSTTDHEVLYTLMGNNIGGEMPTEKIAVLNPVWVDRNGEDLHPNVTPYEYLVTSSDNLTFTLETYCYADCVLTYDTKEFDYLVRYGVTTITNENTAMSSSASVYYVAADEELELTVPTDGGRYYFNDYYLYDFAATQSLKSSNVNGEIVAVDLNDPEVLKLSGFTRDIKILGREKSCYKKVVWKDASDDSVLQKDFLENFNDSSVFTTTGNVVISNATITYTGEGTGRNFSLNNPTYPTKSLTMSTEGVDYDLSIALELQTYDYEVTIDYGTVGKSNETRYISDGDSITLGSNNALYSDDGASRYVMTAISGAPNITGPSGGNKLIEWGWPSATLTGFSADTAVSVTLQQFNNRVLWNIEAFTTAPGSSYEIQKYTYAMDGATSVLNVPVPYEVTAVTTGANPANITLLTYTQDTVSATVTGGDCSVRVTAQAVGSVITWVIDGVTTRQSIAEGVDSTEKTILTRATVASASADNATDVTFSGKVITVENIVDNPTITVTTTPYDHELTIIYYDAYYNEQTSSEMLYVVGDLFEKTYDASEYKQVMLAEVDTGTAQVSKTDSSFTVSDMVGDVVVVVDLLKTEEKLTETSFATWNGMTGVESNGVVSINVGTQSSPVIAMVDISYSAYNVFTVSAPKACVVAITNDGGTTYSEIRARLIEGKYVFEFQDTSGEYQIAILQTGDVDKNGLVNSSDAMRINRYSVGLTTNNAKISSLGLIAADVDGNLIVNSSDAMRINRYSVGLTTNNAKINWHTK